MKMTSKKINYSAVGFMLLVFGCVDSIQSSKLDVQFYDNQMIKEIGYRVDSLKVGSWYEFDGYGHLQFIFNYKNGVLSGEAIEYRQGKLFGKYNFENGELNGTSKLYQSTEVQLLDITNYHQGNLKGLHLSFDSLGIIDRIEIDESEVIYSRL